MRLVTVLAALCIAASPSLAAQETEAGSAEDRSVLDGVYTEEQADRGELTYDEWCSMCHAPSFFAGASFQLAWSGRSVRDLYNMIRYNMPYDNPGGLRAAEYADIVAYIFSLNSFPAGGEELPSEETALRAIRIEKSASSAGR